MQLGHSLRDGVRSASATLNADSTGHGAGRHVSIVAGRQGKASVSMLGICVTCINGSMKPRGEVAELNVHRKEAEEEKACSV